MNASLHSSKIYHTKQTYTSQGTYLPLRASAPNDPLARGPFLVAPGERASVNVEPCFWLEIRLFKPFTIFSWYHCVTLYIITLLLICLKTTGLWSSWESPTFFSYLAYKTERFFPQCTSSGLSGFILFKINLIKLLIQRHGAIIQSVVKTRPRLNPQTGHPCSKTNIPWVGESRACWTAFSTFGHHVIISSRKWIICPWRDIGRYMTLLCQIITPHFKSVILEFSWGWELNLVWWHRNLTL